MSQGERSTNCIHCGGWTCSRCLPKRIAELETECTRRAQQESDLRDTINVLKENLATKSARVAGLEQGLRDFEKVATDAIATAMRDLCDEIAKTIRETAADVPGSASFAEAIADQVELLKTSIDDLPLELPGVPT